MSVWLWKTWWSFFSYLAVNMILSSSLFYLTVKFLCTPSSFLGSYLLGWRWLQNSKWISNHWRRFQSRYIDCLWCLWYMVKIKSINGIWEKKSLETHFRFVSFIFHVEINIPSLPSCPFTFSIKNKIKNSNDILCFWLDRYHAFCVGFDPEGTSENTWLCPRYVKRGMFTSMNCNIH